MKTPRSPALGLHPPKIVAGGQTGADRAALDWALARGVAHGGWCPKGRWAEDGPIPRRYRLRQAPSAEPAQRTEWNVRDADATVIFSLRGSLTGGSLLTRQLARRYGKPCLHLSARHRGDPAASLRAFVRTHRVRVLNVAGPRASREAGLGRFVQETLERAFNPRPGRDTARPGKQSPAATRRRGL
jgi:hypothetical protein